MQIRFLEYLIALERERHFARAAAACHVSQPTLSAGIAKLEEELRTRLVERDRRFIGLTADGKAVLPWARQMVAANHSLQAIAGKGAASLSGEVRVGYIPAATPALGYLAQRLQSDHPKLTLSFRSLSSEEILSGIASLELDAGLTYVDHDPLPNLISVTLYQDQFLALMSDAAAPQGHEPVALANILSRPLCLLPQTMQNRRILDEALERFGAVAEPTVMVDSFDALMSIVSTGRYVALLPESYRQLVPPSTRIMAIDPPLPAARIGLILPDHNIPTAAGQAVLVAARLLRLPAHFSPC